MSLIVAVENISDLLDTVLITDDMVNSMIALDASRAGFVPGETPTLKDALYGMILTSGADASLAVAKYVSCSEIKFVELMNKKAGQMGLKILISQIVSGFMTRSTTALPRIWLLFWSTQSRTISVRRYYLNTSTNSHQHSRIRRVLNLPVNYSAVCTETKCRAF